MVLVHAEGLQLFFGCGDVGLGVLLSVLRLFQHGLGNGAVLEQILGATIALVGELFVVGCFQICVESTCDVGALHLHQQLSLLHVVVEAGPDVHDAAVRHRDDGDLARDIGKDGAGGVQFAGRLNSFGLSELKLFLVIAVDRNPIHVMNLDDMGGWRSAVAFRFAFAAGKNQGQ